MNLQLQGKTALITGGSKGIGKAIALRLAQNGCHLHLAARNAEDLEKVAVELRAKYAVSVIVHPTDLSDSDNAAALVEACATADILVNNAGAIAAGSISDIDEATWREGWDLKVYGFVNLARDMYRAMKARGHGVILNVIGIAGGEVTEFNYIAGTTGNAGLAAFTRAMGGGSPADNIRVLGINPGMTATERLVNLMRQNAVNKGLDPDDWRQLTTTMPFGRLAEPEEVADLCAFLVSDRAAYISGTVVTIDGGLSARGHLFD
jgi:NAD(P)-dependent dehydrogenase (short-subunit alcohol dehydrogenase family)